MKGGFPFSGNPGLVRFLPFPFFQPHIVASVIKKEVRSKKVIIKKKFHLIPILYGDFPLKETRSSVRPVKGDTR